MHILVFKKSDFEHRNGQWWYSVSKFIFEGWIYPPNFQDGTPMLARTGTENPCVWHYLQVKYLILTGSFDQLECKPTTLSRLHCGSNPSLGFLTSDSHNHRSSWADSQQQHQQETSDLLNPKAIEVVYLAKKSYVRQELVPPTSHLNR